MDELRRIKEILDDVYSDGAAIKQPDNNRHAQRILDIFSDYENKWISVDEKLPEADETVLCYCRIWGRYVGCMTKILYTNNHQWSNSTETGILPPTYWQPIPEPPKEG